MQGSDVLNRLQQGTVHLDKVVFSSGPIYSTALPPFLHTEVQIPGQVGQMCLADRISLQRGMVQCCK